MTGAFAASAFQADAFLVGAPVALFDDAGGAFGPPRAPLAVLLAEQRLRLEQADGERAAAVARLAALMASPDGEDESLLGLGFDEESLLGLVA